MEFMTPVDKYMISGVHRIRIGSLDENEIVVRSPEMIGVQTEFVENENGWIICDTGSRSLTVDGNPVQSGYKLKCGDIIELGALTMNDNILKELRKHNNDFLKNELGIPSNESITGIEYDYAWGKIFSYYDNKSSETGIVIVYI